MEEYPNIGLNIGNEYKFYFPRDIMYCRAEGNYSYVHFANGLNTTSAKKLKDLEALLPPNIFIRIHHSYIINLMYVSKFINDESHELIMKNGEKVTVSRRKKSIFLKKFMKL
ncbi:MAG: two-component system LytT family response regulator [Saprospiraceae bacterium]|jgi:two-component system LytT family response regulator|tara:strand:+ start:185 stop:520 length:336 start_codon:yes stop_codon:yes gene_type:complete